MLNVERSLLVVAVGTCLLGAAAAQAQETSNVIGPPQLRDFQLQPKQTIVTQPDPNTRPVQVAPPPPTTATPANPPARREPAPGTQPRREPQPDPSQPLQAPPPAASMPGPAQGAPAETQPTFGAPLPAEPATPAPAQPSSAGTPWYVYALGLGLLVLAGAALLRRRRRDEEEETTEAVVATAAAPPPPPRVDPVPRPWLELDLKTQRASFTETEAVIQFELSIANTGGSPARNLRIDVKMFNAGREQDQEIGAFFKTAGRTVTKLNLPGIGADSTGVIRGEVAMPLEEMRAVKLDGRMLFIPVIAVNALYDYGENRTGHSAKSYVVGRELQETSDKMGAFRVDQGPRIWRTVGQRPHSLAKRV